MFLQVQLQAEGTRRPGGGGELPEEEYRRSAERRERAFSATPLSHPGQTLRSSRQTFSFY